ncbi:unnamed protein product, partial [Rotaria magnacalcarata]
MVSAISSNDDFYTMLTQMKFQDVKQCQKYIEERSKNDRLVMIVRGPFGQEIVPSIHKLRQVISIYVYCFDKVRNKQWSDKFTK